MDVEFEQKGISCMKCLLRQGLNQEQTQEIRLPEGMHDAGQILASWGQVVIRGKEWRADTIACNAGIMAWVLYAPEDGSAPETLETWIPFQMKWDLNDGMREGYIRIQSLLRGVDARIISARKILVRCSVGAVAEAWQEDTVHISVPGTLPEDVQLLTKRYPVRVPRLAGERAFQLEEALNLPGSMPQADAIIAYMLEPRASDTRILSGKLVFHGVGQLHLVYRSEEGKIISWNTEIPISQYAELDRDVSQDAQADALMSVTALELELDPEGQLHLKCGILCQYLVDDREMLEVVEDAYSTRRELELQVRTLDIPVILEQKMITVPVRQTLRQAASEIADVIYLPDLPQIRRMEEVKVEIPGIFQLLSYTDDGVLRGASARTEENRDFAAAENSHVAVSILPGTPAAAVPGSGIELNGETQLKLITTADNGMRMIAGMNFGDVYGDGEERPSLILRRAGKTGLWNIARESRSTVEQIKKANHLESEPEEEQILLIPVS